MNGLILSCCRVPARASGERVEADESLPVLTKRIAELPDARLRLVFTDVTGADAGSADASLDAEVGGPWRDEIRNLLVGSLDLLYGGGTDVVLVALGAAAYAFAATTEGIEPATDAFDGLRRLSLSGITDAPVDQDEIDRLVALAASLGLGSSDLDGDVHDLKGEEAASIDNEGFEGQIAYLVSANPSSWAEGRLRRLARQ